MADQSQTTADTPPETTLCKVGCGFFGSETTGGYCSKCWRELQKKQGKGKTHSNERPATISSALTTTESSLKPIDESVPSAAAAAGKPTPMDVDAADSVTGSGESVSSPALEEKASASPEPSATPKKRKKKKASYKSMMKSMMQSNTPDRSVEKEKESLRKVTGGGNFTKVDKI